MPSCINVQCSERPASSTSDMRTDSDALAPLSSVYVPEPIPQAGGSLPFGNFELHPHHLAPTVKDPGGTDSLFKKGSGGMISTGESLAPVLVTLFVRSKVSSENFFVLLTSFSPNSSRGLQLNPVYTLFQGKTTHGTNASSWFLSSTRRCAEDGGKRSTHYLSL